MPWAGLSAFLLLVVGVLLIFIVLLQRGRGGGLAGAFGGLGGQSAFGTKAGDVFTKITVVLATLWVVLAAVTGYAMRADANRLSAELRANAPETPELDSPTSGTAGGAATTAAGTSDGAATTTDGAATTEAAATTDGASTTEGAAPTEGGTPAETTPGEPAGEATPPANETPAATPGETPESGSTTNP